MQEIIENASYQIPSEYSDKLLGGIILILIGVKILVSHLWGVG